MVSKKAIERMKVLYINAKKVKVGDQAKCPYCETVFTKTNYQQAFCKTRVGTVCKDGYWNHVVPSKRNNTTRISPANAAFKRDVIDRKKEESEFYDDDPSWDAHKNY